MLNCFFFLQSSVHKRFIHAKNGGINDITYYLKNELIYCIYCSLINILFKIIIIKLVLNRGLRIKDEDKKMMDHSYENEITEDELEDWGLGIGDWGLGPIPNPQSPIPNPQSPIPKKFYP